MAPLAPAQPAPMQAALGEDAGTLSDKLTALARVMSTQYDWNPSPRVRSVGAVFNLMVKENHMLAGVSSGINGGKARAHQQPEKLQEALQASYADLQRAIAGLSDNDLQVPVPLFGKNMIKKGALMLFS